MLKEFREFAMKGNVVDLAIGVIIGAAFSKIVDSLVKDIISKSDVVLDIFSEERQRVVVGVNASGLVRDLQLRLRIKFRLRTPAGKAVIADVELFQQRDLSFTETAALSKEIEEATMYRDMQTDIVQQIMRRLGAVRAL